tara:strand:- start:516 stop:1415 length:900 start_codon:yes stop_codon:yes gene_type:complete
MDNKSWFLVIALGFLWGSSFLFVEILLDYMNPFLIVYLRVAIASIILIFYLFFIKIDIQFSNTLIFNLFIMGLLNNVFPFLLITNGQQYITGGLASILNANTSFMTILIASLFIKNEKITKSRFVGVLFGMIGVIVTIGYKNLSGIFSSDIGKFFILLSSISYAFAAIFAKIKLNSVDPKLAATGMLTTSTIILSPIMFFYYSNTIYDLSIISIKYSIAFAVLCSVLAYLIYFKILSTTGPGNLLLCTIIIPPSSIILNAIFINETINIHEFLGMMIIVFGLLILDGRILKQINFYKKF